MVFKSINKWNSLFALIVLVAGYLLLLSKLFTPITMYALFFAGIIAVLILKIKITDLMKPLRKSDIPIIFWGFLFSFVIAIASAIILKNLHVPLSSNPIHKDFVGDIPSILIRLLKTLPQLLGEELLTLLPFLMIIRLGTYHGMPEKTTAIIGLLITSIAFGLLHLSAYNWNLLQCLLVISLARIPFTLAFIKSKSVTVSWIIHVLYDWATFIIGILLPAIL